MEQNRDKLQSDATARWRREQRVRMWGRIVRWGIAGVLFVISFPLLGLFAPFAMLFGCILIAPDIAGYISQFAGSLLWPRREGTPQPLYGIPESLVAKGKYAEAEAEYEKIIQEFPNEIKPHVDMINIAIRWMEDGRLAEELYQRGMTLLQDPTDRDTFTQMYTAIRTRLKSQDEKNGRTIPFENVKDIRERLARDRHKLWR